MSATSHLPVELWLAILEHALDFFFSLDPAADYIDNPAGLSDWLEVRRWGDEVFQQRLVLRQVCRTWREFVDRPEIRHRFAFACLRDIGHSTLSDTRHSVMMAELLQARRIEGSFCPLISDHELAVMDQLRETAASGGTFDAEILNNIGNNLANFVVHTNSSAFPRLKALSINANYIYAQGLFQAISAHFPSTRFLSIRTSTGFYAKIDGICLPSLSTLVIDSILHLEPSLDQSFLPSLCHLQIGAIVGVLNIQRLVNALAVLQHQLRVLDVTLYRAGGKIMPTRDVKEPAYEGYDAQIMSQFWNHFPKLESLRFPMYLIISHPPTRHHPIRYLINSDVKPAHYTWKAPAVDATSTYTDALVAFCLAAPGLAVLRESHDWNSIASKEVQRIMLEENTQVEALGTAVRFQDRWGWTWKESQC